MPDDLSLASRRRLAPRVLGPLLAFLWPLFYFGDRLVPLGGTVRGTNNDFIYLYWAYKAYLLDCLARLRFPLWSPTEGAGFPFYASPFTQAFYPLNLPLALFHAQAGGYSWYDHQVFTVLGAAVFALGVYAWLRSLGHGRAAAVFAACLVSTSFRMADMLRVPNAVHTAAWYPWILLAFNRILGAHHRRELVRWLLGLFVFLLFFLTAGYLYYVYYAVFLLLPYLLLTAIPGLRRARLVPDAGSAWLRRMALIALACAAALVLCLPYLLKVKQLLDATSGRTGPDVAGDGWYRFYAIDTLRSLVFPVGACPEGCYYFGLAGLLLILLYLCAACCSRPGETGERLLCLLLLGWFLLVSLLSYEEDSWLFLLLKHALPGLHRLRVWGRIGIVLLHIVAWLLARAFAHFQTWTAAPSSPGRRLLLGASLAILGFQAMQVHAGVVHRYYPVYFPELTSWAAWPMVSGLLAFAGVAGLAALVRVSRAAPRPWTTLAVLLAVTVVDVWPVGGRLWSERQPFPRRSPFDVPAVLRQSLSTPRRPKYGSISVDYDPGRAETRFSPEANLAVIPQWYFERYARFLARTAQEPREREYLLGLRDGRRLFLSERVDQDGGVRAFLEDWASFGGAILPREYTGDRLEVDVQVPRAGFLTFVDNWDPDWRAFVDGRRAPVLVVVGTFKAVAVPTGAHRVAFRYEPSPWGEPPP